MRIALFTETYFPHVNGVVTHVKTLKEGLEALGHQVLIVTAETGIHHHYIKDGVLYCPAVTLKRFYGYGTSLPVSRRRMKLIKEFNPDIVHIHNEFSMGLTALIYSRLYHVPLVYTLHTMYDDYLYYVAPGALNKPMRKISRRYIRMLADHSSALTGPSKKCEEYFRSSGVKKAVHLIPNSVELDEFSPDRIDPQHKKEFRERYGIREDEMVACFVGRMGKEKSVDVLLDYWKKVITPEDGIHLILIGDGPNREELEEYAKSIGVDSMVTFAGKVPHDMLPPYYASCDVYITASLSEMYSISMLEGMASGLPVLQRLDPMNQSQITIGVNGFIYETPEEMGAELKRIKGMSEQELSSMKDSVRSTVSRSSSQDLAGYIYPIYEKILNQGADN